MAASSVPLHYCQPAQFPVEHRGPKWHQVCKPDEGHPRSFNPYDESRTRHGSIPHHPQSHHSSSRWRSTHCDGLHSAHKDSLSDSVGSNVRHKRRKCWQQRAENARPSAVLSNLVPVSNLKPYHEDRLSLNYHTSSDSLRPSFDRSIGADNRSHVTAKAHFDDEKFYTCRRDQNQTFQGIQRTVSKYTADTLHFPACDSPAEVAGSIECNSLYETAKSLLGSEIKVIRQPLPENFTCLAPSIQTESHRVAVSTCAHKHHANQCTGMCYQSIRTDRQHYCMSGCTSLSNLGSGMRTYARPSHPLNRHGTSRSSSSSGTDFFSNQWHRLYGTMGKHQYGVGEW